MLKKNNLLFKLILIITTVFVFTYSNAQELVFKSKPAYDLKVLIVPFDPRIYYNDATDIIAKKNGKTHDQIMEFFRYELNRALNIALMDSCIVVDLFSEDTRRAREDISGLYSCVRYEMKSVMQNKQDDYDYSQNENFFQRHLSFRKNRMENKEKKIKKTRIEKGEIISERQSLEDKYVHISFANPQVLNEIAKRRGIDVFLFINQFDIKGVYEPYMSGDPDSKRNFRVHYSMYDNLGMLYHGGFGHTQIPFYIDDKQLIVDRYFPEIIRQIISNIDFF